MKASTLNVMTSDYEQTIAALRAELAETKANLANAEKVLSDPVAFHFHALRNNTLSRMNALHLAGATDYDSLRAELSETKAKLDAANTSEKLTFEVSARLLRERDESLSHITALQCEISETKAQLKSRDATIATMREALEPFSIEAARLPGHLTIDEKMPFLLKISDLRKAKSAYDASKAEKNTLPKCECGKPNNVSCYNPDCCRRA
jgi:uncharacterized small protein (DUF1192 family)